MMEAIPGVTVAGRNLLAAHGEAELDLALQNAAHEEGLPGFERDLLVECKSSREPLDARGVTHFASQVERRGMRTAIIVSLAGITGDGSEVRAAHHEISRYAERGIRILLLAEHELAGMRSAAHLAAVLEHKRQQHVYKLRAEICSAAALRDLDPDKGIRINRGAEAILRAAQEVRDNALRQIIDAARGLPHENSDAAIARARAALQDLAAEMQDRRENPDEDPLWEGVHSRIIEVGAAFLRLGEDWLTGEEGERILRFEIKNTAPQRLRATAGSDLWTLLTSHFLDEIETHKAPPRLGVLAVLSMSVDEIVAIEEMDPWDLYDDDIDY